MKPVEVGVAAGFDGNDQELWGLVAVQLMEARFQCGDLIGVGLEHQDGFCGGLDLSLPVVDGLGGGKPCGTGCQSLFHQSVGDASGLFETGRCGKNDSNWRFEFWHGELPLTVYEMTDAIVWIVYCGRLYVFGR